MKERKKERNFEGLIERAIKGGTYGENKNMKEEPNQ